jgi:hypothetical protein
MIGTRASLSLEISLTSGVQRMPMGRGNCRLLNRGDRALTVICMAKPLSFD